MKDLCARLPYNVQIHIKGEYKQPHRVCSIDIENETIFYFENLHLYEEYITDCKPYLRPMSSMTKEEKEEYSKVIETLLWTEELDFYNSHHLDYRGLIPMGLALGIPDGMYGTTCKECENNQYCSQSEYVKQNCNKLK